MSLSYYQNLLQILDVTLQRAVSTLEADELQALSRRISQLKSQISLQIEEILADEN